MESKAWVGGVCLETAFLEEGQGGWGRLQALQPGAQGEGPLNAILNVSHPAMMAIPPVSAVHCLC